MFGFETTIYKGSFYQERKAKTVYAAELMLTMLIEHHQINSMIDFGCGVGTWLDVAGKLGIKERRGYEGEWAKSLFTNRDLDVRFQNLEEPVKVEEKFDLCISLEVAEHLSPAAGYALVRSMCSASSLVMFGAAVPGQGGVGHVNEQPQSYWSGIFKEFGFSPVDFMRPKIWDDPKIPFWYRQNTLLYTSDERLKVKLSNLSSPLIDVIHPKAYNLALSPGIKGSVKAAASIPSLVFKRYFSK